MTEQLHALIIEDDEDLANIFFEALKAAGFKPEIAKSGKVGAQRLEATTPNVVVLDLHLPDISGVELLQKIRTEERLAGTRVLIATADALLGQALEEQADLVLIKPISFSQLRDLAKRLGSVSQGT